MKEEKKKRKIKETREQGITLIALVITVIILLILATVTLNVVLGEGGLIDRAKQAKNLTEQATLKEQEELNTLMDEYANIMAGDSQQLVTEIILNPTTLELEKGETSKLTATIVPSNAINKTIEWNSDNTEIAQVSQDGTVTAISEGNTVITARTTDGSNIEATCSVTVNRKLATNVNELIEGDYVNYVDSTGISRLCAVLYDSSSEYGVEIITMNIVEDIEFGNEVGYSSETNDFEVAMNSYNNAITTLNERASTYNNDIYSDRARSVGSVPNNPNYDAAEMYVSDMEAMNAYNGKLKNSDNNYVTDWSQIKRLNISGPDDENYWLASREVEVNNSDFTSFDIRGASGNYMISYLSFCYISPDGKTLSRTATYGLKPVFRLKSGIKITGGSGTELNPYTLGT